MENIPKNLKMYFEIIGTRYISEYTVISIHFYLNKMFRNLRVRTFEIERTFIFVMYGFIYDQIIIGCSST